MLLDPFEKQFDLPATAIQLGYGERRQGEVVGNKDQRLGRCRIFEANAPQRRCEILLCVKAGEKNGLVADQTGRPVDRMRVAAFDPEVGLAAGDEEATCLVEPVQSLEVEKAPIHDVESAGFGQQLVEDIDFVHLAIADVDKSRDVATQIEQRVQLDRCLGRTKRRPRKHRQAQVDGGGIQGIDRLVQIDAERFVDIQRPRDTDQTLGEVGVNTPVANGIGIGQSIACHGRSENPGDTVSSVAHANTLRCRADSPGTSVVQRPCTEIDPGTKTI